MMYGIEKTKVESKRIEIRSKLVECEIKEPGNIMIETTKAELRGFLQALDWMDRESTRG